MSVKADIVNNIGKFSATVRRQAPGTIGRALLKGGGIVKREAQIRAPDQKAANQLKVTPQSPKDEVRVGLARKAKGKSRAWAYKFYESGTKRHKISPKNWQNQLSWPAEAGKFNVKMKSGKIRLRKFYQQGSGLTTKMTKADWIYLRKGQSVNHPGQKKEPFIRPAGEAKRQEVRNVLADATLKLMASAAKGGIS
jgi:HK97 gp10 family phage protein